MEIWLERDRCRREEEIIEKYLAEGHDPIKVAAAALKLARVEEKQRPIEKIGEVQFGRSRSNKGSQKQPSSRGTGKNHRKKTQRQSRNPNKGWKDISF